MAERSLIQSLEHIPQYFVVERVITGLALETHIYDANCPANCRVVGCWFIATQAPTGACTGRLDDGAANITEATDLNVGGDRDIFRCAEIDNAGADLAYADTLDYTLSSAAGRVAGRVYVMLQQRQPA